jgi:transcription elongation factor Elf1
VDYIETLGEFLDTKLEKHLFSLDLPCSECGEMALRYENIDGGDPYFSVLCKNCGRFEEDALAKEIIVDVTSDIYLERLQKKGMHSDEIHQYLQDRLTFTVDIMTEEELIDDFELWKEQSDLATDKILDANYYSQL